MGLFSIKSSIKHTVGEGIHPNVVDCLKATLFNTREMEKYVSHIYSTSVAQPISCPCVQFAVFFVSDSGKERHFL